MSAGRYWMRLSRFLTTAASWSVGPVRTHLNASGFQAKRLRTDPVYGCDV
jgi:hypothetical protein